MTNFDISFQTKTILSAFCFCARNDWWGFLEIWRTFPIKWKLISHNELRLKLFNTNRFSSILPIDGNYHVRWLYNLFSMLLLGGWRKSRLREKKSSDIKNKWIVFRASLCLCLVSVITYDCGPPLHRTECKYFKNGKFSVFRTINTLKLAKFTLTNNQVTKHRHFKYKASFENERARLYHTLNYSLEYQFPFEQLPFGEMCWLWTWFHPNGNRPLWWCYSYVTHLAAGSTRLHRTTFWET